MRRQGKPLHIWQTSTEGWKLHSLCALLDHSPESSLVPATKKTMKASAAPRIDLFDRRLAPFLLPFFDCDHFRIPWKDLGHQDALNFFISISTAVGEHRQFVILVRCFQDR